MAHSIHLRTVPIALALTVACACGGPSVESGFEIERLAELTFPTGLAIPPADSPFGHDLLVGQRHHGLGPDSIIRLRDDGSTETVATLVSETNPLGLELSPDDGFGPWLYVVGRGRDGRPGPLSGGGGSIVRVSVDGDVEDFTSFDPPPARLPDAFRFGWSEDHGWALYVTADGLLRISPDRTVTPMAVGSIAPEDFRWGPIAWGNGSLFGAPVYAGEYEALLAFDPARDRVDELRRFPDPVMDVEHGSGGDFGLDLYVATQKEIYALAPSGGWRRIARGFEFLGMDCLEFSRDGSTLFVSDYLGHALYRITATRPLEAGAPAPQG